MKQKKWLLPLCIFAALLLCVLLHLASGFTISTGRCLMAEPANCFMVVDNRPVKLNYKGKINFQTGDKLLVLHQNVYAESYPEQTRAYLILKTGSGTKNLVPKREQEILIETANPPERILTASEITTVRIALEDSKELYHKPNLAGTVETNDPELIALVAALRDGLIPRDVNRPMDFPRYVITFVADDGCTNVWRLDQIGVINGDHLGLGNHWLDSSEPYNMVTAVFESLS